MSCVNLGFVMLCYWIGDCVCVGLVVCCMCGEGGFVVVLQGCMDQCFKFVGNLISMELFVQWFVVCVGWLFDSQFCLVVDVYGCDCLMVVLDLDDDEFVLFGLWFICMLFEIEDVCECIDKGEGCFDVCGCDVLCFFVCQKFLCLIDERYVYV